MKSEWTVAIALAVIPAGLSWAVASRRVPVDADALKQAEAVARDAQPQANPAAALRAYRRWLEFYPNEPSVQAGIYRAMALAAERNGDPDQSTVWSAISAQLDPDFDQRLASGNNQTRGAADNAAAAIITAGAAAAAIQQLRAAFQKQPRGMPIGAPPVAFPMQPVGTPGAVTPPPQPMPGYGPQPAVQSVPQTAGQPMPQPIPLDPNGNPISQPISQPVPQLPQPAPTNLNGNSQQLTQPMPQPMPQAVPQPMPQPVSQPMPQPLPQPMPQPVSQPMPQLLPQPMPQPVSQPMPQLLPQPTPQPVSQPMPQALPQPMPQPVSQPMPQALPQPMPQLTQPMPQAQILPQQQPQYPPPQPRPYPQQYRQPVYVQLPRQNPYMAPQYYARPQGRNRNGEAQPIRVVHDHSRLGDTAYFEQPCGALLLVEGRNLTFTPSGGEGALVIPASEIVEIRMNTAVGREVGAFHIITRLGLYLHLAPESAQPEDGRTDVDELRKQLGLDQ